MVSKTKISITFSAEWAKDTFLFPSKRNGVKKEFNQNSNNIDELIEDSRTLKRYHKSIIAKVCGEDSAKSKLHKEIDALINSITARIDTFVK